MKKSNLNDNRGEVAHVAQNGHAPYLLEVLADARNGRENYLSFEDMRRIPEVVLPMVSTLYCGFQTVVTHGWDENANGSRANVAYWLERPGSVSSTSPVIDGPELAYATGCREDGAQLQRDLARYPVVETIRERTSSQTFVMRLYALKERMED